MPVPGFRQPRDAREPIAQFASVKRGEHCLLGRRQTSFDVRVRHIATRGRKAAEAEGDEMGRIPRTVRPPAAMLGAVLVWLGAVLVAGAAPAAGQEPSPVVKAPAAQAPATPAAAPQADADRLHGHRLARTAAAAEQPPDGRARRRAVFPPARHRDWRGLPLRRLRRARLRARRRNAHVTLGRGDDDLLRVHVPALQGAHDLAACDLPLVKG